MFYVVLVETIWNPAAVCVDVGLDHTELLNLLASARISASFDPRLQESQLKVHSVAKMT